MGSPTVTPKVEGTNIGDIIKAMWDPNFCIKQVTLKTDTYVAGQILEPSGSEWKKLSFHINAEAILLEAVVSAGDAGVGMALIRGPAIVDGDKLDYNSKGVATTNGALLDELILVKANVTA